MIKSMTGFGKSNLSANNRDYQVEIRSVNHRYLDISIRMPRQLAFLEEEVKKIISSQIKRGKIDVTISFENNSIEGRNIKINTEIAKLYIEQLRNLAQEENILSDIQVTEITKLPDVLNITIDQDDEAIKKELLEATNIAVNNLIEMKQTEGNKIAEDLTRRINYIEERILKISELSTGLIEEYVVKLEERIKEILKTDIIDKSRIAQEVVIYADKTSIEEEITRLKSHIIQFKKFLNEKEAIGKKIDFLIQEMNRETNTIGSKANNLDIVNGVIDIKAELENIREQIQNIE